MPFCQPDMVVDAYNIKDEYCVAFTAKLPPLLFELGQAGSDPASTQYPFLMMHCWEFGRSTRIRTLGPLVPNQVLYLTELHSDFCCC